MQNSVIQWVENLLYRSIELVPPKWEYKKQMTPIVMLNLFNFVQFAYARHSSSKLASALAQSQISASLREPFLVLLRSQILKQVQDDDGFAFIC